jgi:hypothetical protein
VVTAAGFSPSAHDPALFVHISLMDALFFSSMLTI